MLHVRFTTAKCNAGVVIMGAHIFAPAIVDRTCITNIACTTHTHIMQSLVHTHTHHIILYSIGNYSGVHKRHAYSLIQITYTGAYTLIHNIDMCIHAHTHNIDRCIHAHTHNIDMCIHAHTHNIDMCIHAHTHNIDRCIHTTWTCAYTLIHTT